MVKRQRKTRKQRGGSPSYGYTGETIRGAGAPLEAWTASDIHCEQAGGRRRQSRRRKQRGGSSCGCMKQAGGSSCGIMKQAGGGVSSYSLNLNNDLGKEYSGILRTACPAAQVGGAAIDSYPAGYGLVNPYNSSNANFLEYQSYGRQCMGGGRRRRSRSRSHRNRSRKH